MAEHSFQSFANGGKNHSGASGFHARAGSAFANLSKNCSGRITRHNRDGNDASTGGFDFFASHNLITRPVAALYQHIGKQARDDFARRERIENHYRIDAFERGENFSSFPFRAVISGIARPLSIGGRWRRY